MVQNVNSQISLPAGQDLRCEQTKDGVRITRNFVSAGVLFRQSVLVLVILGLYFAVFVYGTFWCVEHWELDGFNPQFYWHFWLALLFPITLFRIRRIWQNLGVVTEISVSDDTFFWSKQVLWGSKECSWPIDEMTFAEVPDGKRLVMIRRRNGPPLGAFSSVSREDLERAVMLLNLEFDKHRQKIAPA
jgi:hypothetical protein